MCRAKQAVFFSFAAFAQEKHFVGKRPSRTFAVKETTLGQTNAIIHQKKDLREDKFECFIDYNLEQRNILLKRRRKSQNKAIKDLLKVMFKCDSNLNQFKRNHF